MKIHTQALNVIVYCLNFVVGGNPITKELELLNLRKLNLRLVQEIDLLRDGLKRCQKTLLENETKTPLSRFIDDSNTASAWSEIAASESESMDDVKDMKV